MLNKGTPLIPETNVLLSTGCGAPTPAAMEGFDARRVCSGCTSEILRFNSFQLHQGRFRLGSRKDFFTDRVVNPRNRLPRWSHQCSKE